jgi:hypothetical protein
MARRETTDIGEVARAVVEAVSGARWQCAELLTRKDAHSVRDLLLAHAAELAGSALARDQLLGKALEAAAADLHAGRPPLEEATVSFFREPVPSEAREAVREQVFRHCGIPSRASDAAAAELERRLRSDGLSDGDLSEALAAEARLHECLWDDPRLSAETHTRLIMLFAVPKIIERSEALDPSRARHLARRETPRSRRMRALTLARPGGPGRAPQRPLARAAPVIRRILGRGLASLTVGALFGLAMSTGMEDLPAVASGTAAAAYVYGTFTYLHRAERRRAAEAPPTEALDS